MLAAVAKLAWVPAPSEPSKWSTVRLKSKKQTASNAVLASANAPAKRSLSKDIARKPEVGLPAFFVQEELL